MKTPSNKHQVAHELKPKVVKERSRDQQAKTKRLSASGDKKSGFLLLLKKTVSLYKKLPGFTKLILVAILIIFVVIPEVESWPPKLYLLGKYGKVFHVKKTTGPRWIGQEYTYYGEAYPLFEFGDKRIRFNVNCGAFGDCVDFYLENSWGRSEERSIRKYLADILPQSVEIKVGITSKVEQLDDSLQVASFEHYLKKHSTKLVDSYQVMFLDKTRSTNIQLGKQIIGKTSDYIKNKVGTGGIHYAIYNGSEKECISNYDTHKKDKTVNNEINFENAPGVKGEEKCR